MKINLILNYLPKQKKKILKKYDLLKFLVKLFITNPIMFKKNIQKYMRCNNKISLNKNLFQKVIQWGLQLQKKNQIRLDRVRKNRMKIPYHLKQHQIS